MYQNKAFLRQGAIVLSQGVGNLGVSFALAFTSPALPSMFEDDTFKITKEEGSWIGSVLPAAALLGSLLSTRLVETIGRNRLANLFILPFAASWVVIATAPNVYFVIASRILAGLCLGIRQVADSVYSSECIQVDFRAKLNIVNPVLGTSGLLLVNVAGHFFDWRGIAWAGVTVELLYLLTKILLPEAPYFLLKTGNKAKCLEVMTWLRDSKTEAEKEFKDMTRPTKSEVDSVGPNSLLVSPNRWPVCVAISLHTFQQTCGINAVAFYSNYLFEEANVPLKPATSSTITMFTNVIASISCSYLIGFYHRRSLIRLSSQVLMGSLAMLSLYFYALNSGGVLEGVATIAPIFPLLCILVYIVGFSLAWGPIPFIFLGEGLPSSVRGPASALAISTNYIFTFLVTKTFFSLIENLGFPNVFLIYGGFTLMGMVLMEIYLPETLDKSAAQMDAFYEEGSDKKDK